MILVLGGTLEGRELAGTIAGMGHRVLLTVVSEYGAEMVPEDAQVEVLVGSLDDPGLRSLLRERQVRLIIDATHPYAGMITALAWQAAREMQVPFIRYQRPSAADSNGQAKIYSANDYEQAAEIAGNMGETIFLTIGSKNLKPFVEVGRKMGRRVIARVLPDARSLAECAAAGVAPRDIIAVQGPFSTELNIVMLKEYRANVLVTKDSGKTGGTDTKLEAAGCLGIPVVVVGRPDYQGVPSTADRSDILELIREIHGI
ncbi:MAG: precorrin-6A reductase [Thermincola sp.]|jgi:precorrin-6A/cobalt-precorrin-6A reductase|nr:precorrin-6A reductase [Thermincola sp.]MDT3703597.1 precorrin-6A reductase [Thermincola sp.]